jgi:methyl-accepting chemotaxis protein
MDVTEDGAAAARANAQLEALMSGLSVLEYDSDGHVITSNAPALAALGFAADDVVGKHHRRLMEPEFARTKSFADAWAAALHGLPQVIDIQHMRKDRGPFWTRSMILPVKSAAKPPPIWTRSSRISGTRGYPAGDRTCAATCC